jgi:hypothetical protein
VRFGGMNSGDQRERTRAKEPSLPVGVSIGQEVVQ